MGTPFSLKRSAGSKRARGFTAPLELEVADPVVGDALRIALNLVGTPPLAHVVAGRIVPAGDDFVHIRTWAHDVPLLARLNHAHGHLPVHRDARVEPRIAVETKHLIPWRADRIDVGHLERTAR